MELNGEDSADEELSKDDKNLLRTEFISPPKDKYNLVYIVFLLISIGLLFPYNSFIVGLDYFQYLYPSQKPEFIIPLGFLLTTLFSILVTLSILNYVPLHFRIGFGYVVFVITLLLVPLLDIGIHECTVSIELGFLVTLIATVVVGIANGCQETSYYGLAGMLPERYTQALMLGEAISGTLVAINRIITKAAASSERTGAMVFFLISLLYIFLCIACQVFLYKSSFVRYHVKSSSSSSSSSSTDNVIPLSYLPTTAASSEDDEKEIQDLDRPAKSLQDIFEIIKNGIALRFSVIRKVWPLILSVFLTFFVTLLVFPGIISDVQQCSIGDWPGVILIGLFSVSDTAGRILSRLRFRWNSKWLVLVAVLRFLLVPLFVLCVSPSPTYPVIHNPLWVAAVLIVIVGLSNGYFGTLSMQYAPTKVSGNERELTGAIMVFFLLGGLSLGSIVANVWTPLTNLKPFVHCSNDTAEFFCQFHDNATSVLL